MAETPFTTNKNIHCYLIEPPIDGSVENDKYGEGKDGVEQHVQPQYIHLGWRNFSFRELSSHKTSYNHTAVLRAVLALGSNQEYIFNLNVRWILPEMCEGNGGYGERIPHKIESVVDNLEVNAGIANF